ncbi:MAG TPA: 30S ribosomal protein S16 [Candidatus Paceibacterota bacterium]|nr:30S ribosomal protein S16 [Candidatus Paceibacterota bacterium]
MLMIRFQRIGRRNDPAFRIAVLEKTSGPKAGKFVDLVGSYNPKTKETSLKADAIKDWVSKGAQISPSVMNLLIANKVYEGPKIQVISKKNLEKNKPAEVAPEAPVAEAAPAAEESVEVAPTEEEVAEEAAETEVIAPEAAPAEEAPATEEEQPAA